MTLCEGFRNGYYDDKGDWQRTKFCFTDCGANCNCGPPLGQWYSAAHDKRTGADRGSASGFTGVGCTVGVEASDAVHVPVETTDTPAPSATGFPVSEPGDVA